MCQRFINQFVDEVIKRINEETDYCVMLVEDEDIWKTPYMICSFRSTKKNLANSLYDSIKYHPRYMAYVITNIQNKYPDLNDDLVSDWYVFLGDMTHDQFVHICEIFDRNNGKEIFNWIDNNTKGGLLTFIDNLSVGGRLCLLEDPTRIFQKLADNGFSFKYDNLLKKDSSKLIF